MLVRAILENDASKMPGRLKRLARHVTEALGGFEIDGWRLRTPAK